jgi:hypothetical protein
MICRHRLLLIVRVLTVLTYFMLLVYSVHLLHYAPYIVSDLCITFSRCRTTYNWFLVSHFRFYRPQRAWRLYAMNCLRDALEALIGDLKVQPLF